MHGTSDSFSLLKNLLLLALAFGTRGVFAQNIAVNTTGNPAAAANLFEVTQPAGAANNSIGIFSSNLSTAANAYAIWAQATGAATNKYAIVVPGGGGNVGFGTTTPQVALQVQSTIPAASVAPHPYRTGLLVEGDQNTLGGRIAIRQADYQSNLVLFRTNGTIAAPTTLVSGDLMGGVSFGGYDGTQVNSFRGINAYAAETWANNADGAHLAFNTINIGSGFGTGGTEKMRITSEGYVGINTTLPLGLLHVVSTLPNYADRMSNVANEGSCFIFRKARGTTAVPAAIQNGDEIAKFLVSAYDGSSYLWLGGISAVVNGAVAAGSIPTDLVFGVSSTHMGNPITNEAMRITNGKYVGIGTTNPAAKLEVDHTPAAFTHGVLFDIATTNANINLFTVWASGAGTNTGRIELRRTGTEAKDISFRIANNAYNHGMDITMPASSDDIRFDIIGWGSGALYLKSNGNVGVGIGTTSPAYNLEVNGTFGFGNGTAGSYRSRTETRADAGLIATQSGFFETAAPSPSSDWPTSTANASANFDASGNATNWWHLIDSRHSNNGNNYAMQFSGGFFDQNIYFRKTNNSASTPWSKLVTTSNSVMAPSLTFPDGLSSVTAKVLQNGAAAWSYTVPAGKNLYITNYYSILSAGSGALTVGGTTVIDGLSDYSNVNNPTYMKMPIIVPAGVAAAGPGFSVASGFEVSASITPITQTGLNTTPYTVTAGKTLVILQTYITGGSDMSMSINGGANYYVVRGTARSNVSNSGAQSPLASPLIFPAGTKIKMANDAHSFNGYEF